MTLRPATPAEIANWDELVAANPDGGNYLQGKVWSEFKGGYHWQPHYYIGEGKWPLAAVIASRVMPGFGTMWHLTKGPGVRTVDQLLEVVEAVKQLGLQGLAVKFDPELDEDAVDKAQLQAAGLVKTPRNVQFKATVVVDLRPSEEEIIAGFKQKTRYNIRLAARKGVTVEPVEATDANLDRMFKLVSTTQARAHYFLRSRDYTLGYWRKLAAAGQGQLFFASYEGQVLAGTFAIRLGQKSWYKDGGSIREHHEVMAPYLLQWEMMRWLKGHGADSYDMVGVPPRRELGNGHLLDSLYQFKSGFQSEITEFIGPYDLPLSPLYPVWAKGGERVATAYESRIKHDFLY